MQSLAQTYGQMGHGEGYDPYTQPDASGGAADMSTNPYNSASEGSYGAADMSTNPYNRASEGSYGAMGSGSFGAMEMSDPYQKYGVSNPYDGAQLGQAIHLSNIGGSGNDMMSSPYLNGQDPYQQFGGDPRSQDKPRDPASLPGQPTDPDPNKKDSGGGMGGMMGGMGGGMMGGMGGGGGMMGM